VATRAELLVQHFWILSSPNVPAVESTIASVSLFWSSLICVAICHGVQRCGVLQMYAIVAFYVLSFVSGENSAADVLTH